MLQWVKKFKKKKWTEDPELEINERKQKYIKPYKEQRWATLKRKLHGYTL